jgi:hypothetical protein
MLRLRAPVAQAQEIAAELLGFLEAELDAEVDGADGDRGGGTPVLVRLEGLEVELSVDGGGVVLRYVGGSRGEFEELCQFIREAGVGRA